jgi:O-antigen ligase
LAPTIFLLASHGQLGKTASAVAVRAGSVADSRVVQEDSYNDRAHETAQAIRTIEAHPLSGVGVANTYGYLFRVYDPRLGVTTLQERAFTHNALLTAYLHFGVLGVLVLLAFGRAVARRALAAIRGQTDESGVVVAAALALLALALSALAEPYLYYRPTVLTAAVALALCQFEDVESSGDPG